MRVRPGMSRSACHCRLKCPSLPFQRLFRGLLLPNDFPQLFLCAFEPVLVWTTRHGCQAAPRQSNCTKIHNSAMIFFCWCDSAILCETVGLLDAAQQCDTQHFLRVLRKHVLVAGKVYNIFPCPPIPQGYLKSETATKQRRCSNIETAGNQRPRPNSKSMRCMTRLRLKNRSVL